MKSRCSWNFYQCLLISSFAELPLCEGVVEAHIVCAGLVRAPHCQNGPEPVKEPPGPAMLLERNKGVMTVMTSIFEHQLSDTFGNLGSSW